MYLSFHLNVWDFHCIHQLRYYHNEVKNQRSSCLNEFLTGNALRITKVPSKQGVRFWGRNILNVFKWSSQPQLPTTGLYISEMIKYKGKGVIFFFLISTPFDFFIIISLAIFVQNEKIAFPTFRFHDLKVKIVKIW